MENGTVILRVFANDTAGNIGSFEVLLRKDIINPTITINDPTDYVWFNETAPDDTKCDVICNDPSGIATTLYMLINGEDLNDYTENNTWTGEIEQTVWEEMDNGTVIIRIFAFDTAGNIGMNEVIVYKNITASPQTTPPPSGDDDSDGKDKKEGFDIVEFLTSPVGLTIIGGSAAGAVGTSIILMKKLSYKRKIKEIERIERLRKD